MVSRRSVKRKMETILLCVYEAWCIWVTFKFYICFNVLIIYVYNLKGYMYNIITCTWHMLRACDSSSCFYILDMLFVHLGPQVVKSSRLCMWHVFLAIIHYKATWAIQHKLHLRFTLFHWLTRCWWGFVSFVAIVFYSLKKRKCIFYFYFLSKDNLILNFINLFVLMMNLSTFVQPFFVNSNLQGRWTF